MERNEIKKIFEPYYSSLNIYKCKLVEIIIILNDKDNTQLNLMYNDQIQYIDISNNYIAFGGFMINNYNIIKDIKVKFR